MEDETVKEEDCKLADKLGRILKGRLARHIKTKITDQSKHNHPVLLFVRANLNRFAAQLYYFKQGRYSPVMHPSTCLLRQPDRGGFLIDTNRTLEGSYLQ